MSPVRSHPRHALTREDLGAGDLVTGGADVPVTRDPGQGDQETGQQPHDAAGHLTGRERLWDWDSGTNI